MTSKWNILRSAFIGKLLLATCLLGMAAASANAAIVVFQETGGTFTGGAPLSGTITIDTTAHIVTAVNLKIGPPNPDSCTTILVRRQFLTFTEVFLLPCSSGNRSSL